MRAILITALYLTTLCLAFSVPALAQNADTDPASKDDIILYLRTMHSHDMMQKTMQAMLGSMRQMFSEQFEKDGKTPPGDAEKRLNSMMDELIKGMPLDEMMQATIPVYQKHFTKGDIDHLIAFYSSPTGQKLLEEMPAITGESMTAMMPIMLKYMEDSKERVRQQVKEMEKSAAQGDQGSAVQQ
ncbi:MAG: DUF2059 domain-containing protein [Candidatus Sulfotelmatobacter sp.]|jgi:uncharacterized protein